MLNNMDLNAKDSFYPQFDNCNSSSLGMENSARKDNQDVYVDAERGVPAQFGHGEFASLHILSIMCMHYFSSWFCQRKARGMQLTAGAPVSRMRHSVPNYA